MNAKNAFQVDLPFENIHDYAKVQPESKKWINTGEAINVGAKVYGFRIDKILIDTRSMLHGMARGTRVNSDYLEIFGEDDGINDDEDHGRNSLKGKKQTKKIKMIKHKMGQ